MVTGVNSGSYSLNRYVEMADENTTLGLKKSTKEELEPIKEASEATTWDGFVNGIVEENLEVSMEELEAQEVETHERVEQTRATVVGVLEAVDDADMTDEIVDIIKSLSEQDMLAQNQEILEHLMEKSRKGEPINDVDRLLADIVMETESSRGSEQSPAATIAKGLFSGKEHAAAERTKTEREATVQSTAVSDEESDSEDDDLASELFSDTEESDDNSADVESSVTVSNERISSNEEDDE